MTKDTNLNGCNWKGIAIIYFFTEHVLNALLVVSTEGRIPRSSS